MNKYKPEVVEKNWGSEEIIRNTKDYCGKILNIKQGYSGSLHYHLLKEETWYLLNGKLLVETIDKKTVKKITFELLPGDVIHISMGDIHRMTAIENSQIMEVSTQHFDSDTYRIEPSTKNDI